MATSTMPLDFMAELQHFKTIIASLEARIHTLENKPEATAKESPARKRTVVTRSPSGFVKPQLMSDELTAFLGKGKGTQMARTEVTREINSYIHANQLQDKTNVRRINADTKLASLLKLQSGEELTYYNLQRYMSPHFVRSVATYTKE